MLLEALPKTLLVEPHISSPPQSVVYTGAVGDDKLAEQLKEANKREGLDQVYLVKKGEKTGACAVVITGHHRSLVTTLRVAEKFEKSHLSSPEVAPLIENAKFFYLEGYFLTHGVESALDLATKSSNAGKVTDCLSNSYQSLMLIICRPSS
jgi:adenosine kinase